MTLDELRVKLENWKEAWPELTKEALQDGCNIIAQEVRREYSGGVVRQETGTLAKSVQTKVTLNPLTAKVFVKGGQQYKAQTFEQGKTIQAASGRRSKERYSRTGQGGFLQISPSRFGNWYYGRPRSVTVPARPFWASLWQHNRESVKLAILNKIIGGYRS